MASWFRVAEELFEVVDRRAKQVVNERFADDPLVGQNTATDLGVLGRVLPTSPLAKGQSSPGKASTSRPVSPLTSAQAKGSGNVILRSRSLGRSNGYLDGIDTAGSPNDDIDSADNNVNKQVSSSFQGGIGDLPLNLDVATSVFENITSATDESKDVIVNHKGSHKVPTDGDSSHKSSNGNWNLNDTVLNPVGAKPAQGVQLTDVEPVRCRFAAENGVVSVELFTEEISSRETIGVEETKRPVDDRSQISEKVLNGSPPISQHAEHVNDPRQRETPKVEEQLDEAQGLLKNAVSSGQSKEARLARVCAGLSSRLQEYKAENAQLEELVQQEREAKTAIEMKIKQMQLELASAKAATNSVEAEMSAALSSKNSEIEALMNSMEAIKRQAALSEGKLASLQANVEAMARNRDMTETGMIQTLREELEAAEHRAEEEHVAHNATRKAAAQRETELEQRVADVTAALTRMQRTVDERTQKTAELEHKLSTLEIDCASLNQELQEMEARLRREQKRPPEEAAQTLQLQAWREEAERARQAQSEAERKLSVMEAETQKLRVDLSSLKRDADQYSTQAHIELEKRFRELTELLYSKQTQLEAMASEKAAAVLQLEKESRRFREAQAEAERHKRMRHSTAGWDDENDMKPLEYFGLQQRRLVGPSIQRAAKLLDSGAVTAGRFLWRRPLARLGVLFYLVFVHFFLMYLLHRLQEQVVNAWSSKEEMEAAAAAGLVKLGMQ